MAAGMLVSLAGCCTLPKVPYALHLPPGQKVLLRAYANGVQIYAGVKNPTKPGQLVWSLKSPEAMLWNACGKLIGSHYQGPTWELEDGSMISGEVVKHASSPSKAAIPWLLVEAKGHEGRGQLQRVTYIQQVNTTGGLAPSAPPTQVGQIMRSHYTAEYLFYCEKR